MNLLKAIIELHSIVEYDILNFCYRNIKDTLSPICDKDLGVNLNFNIKNNLSGDIYDDVEYQNKKLIDRYNLVIKRSWLYENTVTYCLELPYEMKSKNFYPCLTNLDFIFDFEFNTLSIKDSRSFFYKNYYKEMDDYVYQPIDNLLEDGDFIIDLNNIQNIDDFIMMETLTRASLNDDTSDVIIKHLREARDVQRNPNRNRLRRIRDNYISIHNDYDSKS